MNTNDKMQTTSSASGADERAKFERYMQDDCFRDLQELTINANGNYDDLDVQNLWHSWRTAIAQTAPASQAIVPQVLQAPNETAQDLLYVSMELSGVISEYRSMPCGSLQERMFQTLDRYMPRINKARSVLSQAAPIVATVPSEPIGEVAGSYVGAYGIGNIFFPKGEPLPIGTKIYATPSPTEQASDVRNAVWRIANNLGEATSGFECQRDVSLIHDYIEELFDLATPADKGNAPAEANEQDAIDELRRCEQLVSDAFKNLTRIVLAKDQA